MHSENRIGIFLCNCKKVLSKKVSFKELLAYFKDYKDVEYIEENNYLCNMNTAKELEKRIKDNKLNRVIIAACSPQLKGTFFKNIISESGINYNLISFVNLREQCAMLFSEEGTATRNAINLIESSIRRTIEQEPIKIQTTMIRQSVLVIGGGLAGLQTALNLSKLYYRVILVERNNQLGGYLKTDYFFEGKNVNYKELISKKIEEIIKNNRIIILNQAELIELEGFVGDFKATIKVSNMNKKNEIKYLNIGAIVLSTGCQNYLPADKYGISLSSKVQKLSQLADIINKKKESLNNINSICFISGIISDDQRLQGETLLKLSLKLAEEHKIQVYILCKNVFVAQDGLEELYQNARSKGVLFLKYNKESPRIDFKKDINKIEVSLYDPLLGVDLSNRGKKITISCDLLALEELIIPSTGTKELSEILQITTDGDGFYQQGNISLQPVFTNRKGIFTVGSCRGLKNVVQTVDDSAMVSLEIHNLLKEKRIQYKLDGAVVDDDKCILCLTCLRTCPHKAIQLVKNIDPNQTRIVINGLACERCGLCVSHCPANAIVLPRYKNSQIFAEII